MKFGYLILFLLFLGSTPSASAQCVSPTSDQVSWWRGEGDALDSSDGNHGVLEGGVSFAPGVCDQAFSLDGVDDRVRINDSATLDGMAQLSIEAWVKFSATPAGKWQFLVSKGSAVGFGSNSYVVWLAGDTGKITAAVESNTGLNTVNAPDLITPLRFYHVVTTYDGSRIRLYLDGVLRGSGLLAGPVRNTFFPVFLGRRSGAGVDGRGDVLGGLLDEVRISNRALTASEIALVFGQGSLQIVAADLQAIIDGNPGTPLADKIEDALDDARTALNELTNEPPDNQAVAGNIEGAVGDLESAVIYNLLDPGLGTQLMDRLAGIARLLARVALDQAIAEGLDPVVISEAQQALDEGDALRAAGAFKDAVNKYKDALAQAEGIP